MNEAGLPALTYRQLRMRVRPARVATCIPHTDAGWEHGALRMMENMSVTWGGAGHVLVPLDESGDLHDRLWPLVKLYDADRWAAYVTTWRGMQMANPTGFAEAIERMAKAYTRKYGGGIRHARELHTRQDLMTHERGGWPVPDSFTARLLARTSPSTELDSIPYASYRADGPPGHQLVDVADLDPLPPRVVMLDTSGFDISLQLLIGMVFGALAPSHVEKLASREVDVDVLPFDGDYKSLFKLIWSGHQQSNDWRHSKQLRGENDSEVPRYLTEDFVSNNPLTLSTVGCTRFTRAFPYNEASGPVVVVGSGLNDFTYALLLQRCGVEAMWLPGNLASGTTKIAKSSLEALTECLWRGKRGNARDRTPVLTSLTLTVARLDALKERLAKTIWGGTIDVDVSTTVAPPPFRIPAIMDSEQFDDPIDVPFNGDRMAMTLPVVTPTRVRSKDPWHLTWWIDVDEAGYTMPPRSALNDMTTSGPRSFATTARVTRDGIAFFSHTMGFVSSGSSLKQMVDRPTLRLPTARAIFERLADRAGLALAESSAGRYRRIAQELWGGLTPLASDLLDPKINALLQAWLQTKSDAPGVSTNSKRRFLSLADIREASGLSTDAADALVRRYIDAEVLRVGLLLRCTHCRLMEWYDLDDVGQRFACRRCRSASHIGHEPWPAGASEPTFHYDLAEVVYQALNNDFRVPVLASAAIRETANAFMEMSEAEFTAKSNDGQKIEFDLLAIADGRIILGEAKKSQRLEKTAAAESDRLRKMRTTAEALGADEVVFATTAAAWNGETKKRIASIFDDSVVSTRLLERL